MRVLVPKFSVFIRKLLSFSKGCYITTVITSDSISAVFVFYTAPQKQAV